MGFGPCSDFDTLGHLCFMLIFDEFLCFRALTALSLELPQARQNCPNDQNGDPKQLCLMKNAFYSIILVIQGEATTELLPCQRLRGAKWTMINMPCCGIVEDSSVSATPELVQTVND